MLRGYGDGAEEPALHAVPRDLRGLLLHDRAVLHDVPAVHDAAHRQERAARDHHAHQPGDDRDLPEPGDHSVHEALPAADDDDPRRPHRSRLDARRWALVPEHPRSVPVGRDLRVRRDDVLARASTTSSRASRPRAKQACTWASPSSPARSARGRRIGLGPDDQEYLPADGARAVHGLVDVRGAGLVCAARC